MNTCTYIGGKMANDNDSVCKTFTIHDEMINKVKNSIPNSEKLAKMTEFFRILGDQSRVKILLSLLISELCVCDLSILLKSSQSAISHQLRILRQSDLVKFRKEGKVVYYSLKDDHIETIIDMGLEHINEKI